MPVKRPCPGLDFLGTYGDDMAIRQDEELLMSSPLAGAWELISDVQEGFAVFTQSHFNIYVVGKPGTGFAGGESAEELSDAASRTMRGSGGTYTVSGSAAWQAVSAIATISSRLRLYQRFLIILMAFSPLSLNTPYTPSTIHLSIDHYKLPVV
ncbi:MAG: hypothetical protein IH956_06805 [Chloroflexi bacterium]|nr:hypothetical protein [Chloroflexota bacterium]